LLDRADRLDVATAAPASSLAGRQALFFALVAATMAALLWLMAAALSVGGLDAFDLTLLALFAVTLPWSVIGFWNATIGFLIMRFARDPTAVVCPVAAPVRGTEPITVSTAIVVCIRNESPERLIRNLKPLLTGLVAEGVGQKFHVYLLSDTDQAAIAAAEDIELGAFAAAWQDRLPVTYRRRASNTGFKAGNIRDFCERWGDRHELAVTLDADSFMSAQAVLRLVRVMQANPRLGILQGLVVGMPSTSAFARVFQFGMRLGMRSYTIGSAWWQGDCGPYWGHNAAVRLKPFIAHCQIPPLPFGGPLGGHVLSHDQIEAMLMRRAGYEVRVLPEEDLGWEENPPTLIEFIRRDLRWCQGTLQYWHFLFLPGVPLVSRYQLAFAVLMFLGSPAWMGLLVVATLAVAHAETPADFIRPDAGTALFAVVLVMWFAPKIATVLDVLTRPQLRRAFGGGVRFVANVATETVFFLALSPIMWLGHTIFLGGLTFGRTIGWIGQTRDDHAVPVTAALRQLWPQTLLGWTAIGVLALTHPSAIPYALFIAGGLALSVPLAVVSAWPALGRGCARIGVGRLPEETDPPAPLRGLELAAVEAAALGQRSTHPLRTARGVVRSLRLYYGDRERRAAMDRLYAQFVAPGDLVFDIGAHVGDRTAAFRRRGARVVAVEPQPALVRALKLLYGRDADVTIEPLAVGRAVGTVALNINADNPTVSTASEQFIAAADGAPGWEGQRWTGRIDVTTTTLDRLIARHGVPAFVKIDVEGFEAEVLAGLSQPVPALSFEFTTIQREVAQACLQHCQTLGFTSYNAALGECQELAHAGWQSAEEIGRWLAALPITANSGDIYARRA